MDISNVILFPDEIQSIKNDKSRFIPLVQDKSSFTDEPVLNIEKKNDVSGNIFTSFVAARVDRLADDESIH